MGIAAFNRMRRQQAEREGAETPASAAAPQPEPTPDEVQAERQATAEALAETLPDPDAISLYFPHARELELAGITTRTQLAALSDAELEALPKIGKAAVKKIRAALEG